MTEELDQVAADIITGLMDERDEALARATKAEADLAGCKIALEQAWASIRERDAAIAEAEARALAGVTTLHTVIADIRAATVGGKPMLSELSASIAEMREMDRAQAFAAGYEAGEKAEREAIVTHINGRIDHVDDCAKWGGSKQYLQSLKGGVMELKHCAAAIRKRGEG